MRPARTAPNGSTATISLASHIPAEMMLGT